jgi:hypothetical protein
MKIITSKLTLLIILSTIIVVSSLTIPQNSMAATVAAATVATNVDENSVSLNPISAQDLDTTSGSNQYHTSIVWSDPGTSKMTDVLTASFTNILDTQIYTGLDKITN